MLFFTAIILHGQHIEIGEDAYKAKAIIESSTNDHNGTGHLNQSDSYWNWDVKYNKGQIAEVIQCYSNQYVNGLGDVSYYCKHFMMSDNRLAYTITRFEDIDSIKVTKFFEDNYSGYKIGSYYFSSDFMHYSTINVTGTGQVSIECRKAEWSELSPEMQDTIDQRITDQQEEEQKNYAEKEAQWQQESKTILKTYDLQQHDSAMYDLFIQDLRWSLIDGFKSYSGIPAWSEVGKEKNKYFVFKNSYNALFRINYQSSLSSDSRYFLLPAVNTFKDQNHFEMVHGSDTTCDFLKYASPSLPSIKKDSFYVMTDARVMDINVNYIKGITHIKIEKGTVAYRKFTPPPGIVNLLSDSLKGLRNGLYEIKYEAGTVMDSSFIHTEQIKMQTVGGKVARTAGALILLWFLTILNDE